MRRIPRASLGAFIVLGLCAEEGTAQAVGESVDGFPNWSERVLLEWTNRARVDPAFEMAACGARCAEGACYAPIKPYAWEDRLNRAARFHSSEMLKQGYGLDHTSHCAIAASVATTYPATCDGSTSCACQNACSCVGAPACQNACVGSSFQKRTSIFGASALFEGIASASDPNAAFYSWLFESYPVSACGYATTMTGATNGHRYALIDGRVGGLAATAAGFGSGGGATVGDYGGGATATRIPSGAHYPRQGSKVEAWANWYDAQGPSQALVNVDGTCSPMTLKRGVVTNGAYNATLTGLTSGCHRYFFVFKTASGSIETYPTTGSLGIGPATTCDDWNATRPATGPGCNCVPQCGGKSCGDDGCGGSCGTCSAPDGGTRPDAGLGTEAGVGGDAEIDGQPADSEVEDPPATFDGPGPTQSTTTSSGCRATPSTSRGPMLGLVLAAIAAIAARRRASHSES